VSLVKVPYCDLGSAPDASNSHGRNDELADLAQWIIIDKCRLVALLGLGGVGKTNLSVRIVEQIKNNFEKVIWRSLRESPPLEEVLEDLLKILSNQQEIHFQNSLSDNITKLIVYLRSSRCLLVLDNVESIIKSETCTGEYLEGYQDYGGFFKKLGESQHQSCLIITSRENPQEIAEQAGDNLPVRYLRLNGLQSDGIKILEAKGLSGSENEMAKLCQVYDGNPLALKLVATSISEIFCGNISEFLSQNTICFNGIQDLLDEQFNRLSYSEKTIVYWLAINRESIKIDTLSQDITPKLSQQALFNTIENLRGRSLIESSQNGYTLQNVIMEYVTARLIGKVNEEIDQGKFELLNSHALLKATAKDYVRNSQIRLIIKPILDRLSNSEIKLKDTLQRLQNSNLNFDGYAAGNILNLLTNLKLDLRGYNFSGLSICQAYLSSSILHSINFSNTTFSSSIFRETFCSILSIALDSSASLCATAHRNGEIILWKGITGQQLFKINAHDGWVRSINFSPDGTLICTSGSDRKVKLWDVKSGDCLRTFHGHTNQVYSAVFSHDAKILASGGEEQEVKLWNIQTGQCLQEFKNHVGRVRTVSFHPTDNILACGDNEKIKLWNVITGDFIRDIKDSNTGCIRSITFSKNGELLVAGSEDSKIRIWNIETSEYSRVLEGHTGAIWSVTLNSNGTKLASGSSDNTIRIWDVETGECLETLIQDRDGWIRTVVFHPDNITLVSGSENRAIRLWNTSNGKCLKTIQGYTNPVHTVAFSPDRRTLATGSDDGKIRLWKIDTGDCFKIWQGHNDVIQSIAFNSDGSTLSSGSNEHKNNLKLWQVSTGKCLKNLESHKHWVWSVVFSPDGKTLASCSRDHVVNLWSVNEAQLSKNLEGHTDEVHSVSFSHDGQILASGSDDGSIKLWDTNTHQLIQNLEGHNSQVRSLGFSPNGRILASGSDDRTIKLWDVNNYQCVGILKGHSNKISSLVFSQNSDFLFSGSHDKSIKLWNIKTFQCSQTVNAHDGWILSISLSPDGKILASSSQDETTKLWKIDASRNAITLQDKCIEILKALRPYEGMDITGVKGLSAAEETTLKILGAQIIPSESSSFISKFWKAIKGIIRK
jgi:WD40 repeat protein